MACEYTVLPQEMTSSYSRGGGSGLCRSDAMASVVGGRRGTGDALTEDEDDDAGGRWCSCRRLAPVSTPRPPDPIAYLSGTMDRQPESWRPLSDVDDFDDDAHRHCTCTSGRCRQVTSLSLQPSVQRRTVDSDYQSRRQLACYVITATCDEDADDSAAAASAPPDVQSLAPSVVAAQH